MRSNPGTRRFHVRNCSPFGVSPVPGRSPASTARSSSPPTSPTPSPSADEAAARASGPASRPGPCSSRPTRRRPGPGSSSRRPTRSFHNDNTAIVETDPRTAPIVTGNPQPTKRPSTPFGSQIGGAEGRSITGGDSNGPRLSPPYGGTSAAARGRRLARIVAAQTRTSRTNAVSAAVRRFEDADAGPQPSHSPARSSCERGRRMPLSETAGPRIRKGRTSAVRLKIIVVNALLGREPLVGLSDRRCWIAAPASGLASSTRLRRQAPASSPGCRRWQHR